MKDTNAALLMTTVMLVLGSGPRALAADKEALVSIGEDGKLTYTPDERGNIIPDFSRAGYMGGGVRIPDVPVRKTVTPSEGTDDDTARVQAAIDEVSALKPDGSGFRGALLLRRGTYRISRALRVNASGVVLRGEGQDANGTILLATGTKKRTLIVVGGATKITEIAGSRRKLADSYVPWGVASLDLESARGYSAGDKVVVFRPSTAGWLRDIGMDRLGGRGARPWRVGEYDFHFERVVTAVQGDRISLDAPVVNAMEDRYGGGFVYRCTEEGRISQAGVEHLRLVSEYEKGKEREDEEHAWTGVGIHHVVNAWARNVTAVHFGWGGVQTGSGAKFVTVQDCSYLKPVSQIAGGRRYPYEVSGQFCLTQRCYSEGGRHCNVAGARSRGPNVFLDCCNKDGDSGPHHRWAMGALYDNMRTWSLVAQNRGTMGTGHGWTGAQIVFWNCEANGMSIQRPPTAQNYVIGCRGKGAGKEGGGPKEPHFESNDKPVAPRSLYLKQLEDRLGGKAVENVTTEAQRKATAQDRGELVWDALRYGIGEVPREGEASGK